LAEKRSRNSFKKLFFMNTSRMLKILGYVPSQSDEKKFLYSNYKHATDGSGQPHTPSKNLLNPHIMDDMMGNDTQFVGEMQDKVLSMNGSSIPRL